MRAVAVRRPVPSSSATAATGLSPAISAISPNHVPWPCTEVTNPSDVAFVRSLRMCTNEACDIAPPSLSAPSLVVNVGAGGGIRIAVHGGGLSPFPPPPHAAHAGE